MALVLLVATCSAYIDRLPVGGDLNAGRPVGITWAGVVDVVPKFLAIRIEFYGDNSPEKIAVIRMARHINVSCDVSDEFVPDLLKGFELIVSWRHPRPLPDK